MDKNRIKWWSWNRLITIIEITEKEYSLDYYLSLSRNNYCSFCNYLSNSKKYQSQGSVLLKADVVNGSLDSTQVNTNKMMVNNYVKLLQGNNIQDQVAKNLNITSAEVRSSLSITNTTDTQIIEISSTTVDPGLSKRIVDETISVFTTLIQEKLDVTNVTIVDQPEVNPNPVSPSMVKNVIIGAVAGIVISLGYLLLTYLLDTKIKNGEQAEQYLGVPLLGIVPFFEE